VKGRCRVQNSSRKVCQEQVAGLVRSRKCCAQCLRVCQILAQCAAKKPWLQQMFKASVCGDEVRA
jgi:hypothetical protein